MGQGIPLIVIGSAWKPLHNSCQQNHFETCVLALGVVKDVYHRWRMITSGATRFGEVKLFEQVIAWRYIHTSTYHSS